MKLGHPFPILIKDTYNGEERKEIYSMWPVGSRKKNNGYSYPSSPSFKCAGVRFWFK